MLNYLSLVDNSNNNDNEHDVVGDDEEESPEAKLERERLRRQQNNARERYHNILRLSKQRATFIFSNNSVKRWPILLIFGMWHHENT